ncbi:MAG: hypothetical protein K2X67_02945 [Burkholderiales bacterium]|jgi:hypothetical protein|nr:hypothetical protein [Burkholderiales bacterium]
MQSTISKTLFAISALVSGTVCAGEEKIPFHPALNDRFYIGAGIFAPKTSTEARLDSTTLGVGASVDFESALGLQGHKSVPNFLARWRITERWRVEAEYFELNRTGQKNLERDIQWGDAVFPVGSNVNSKFDFSDTRVSVGYSFFKTVDKELGIALGAHVTRYDASITSNGIGTQGGAVTAPLPVLSAFGQFALTDRWAIAGRLDRFSLTYDQYSGGITSMALDLLYQPLRHVGFGVGYRSMYVDVTSTNTKWTGQITQSFEGPVLYANVSF